MKRIHTYLLMMLFIVLTIFVSPAVVSAEDNSDNAVSTTQVETDLNEQLETPSVQEEKTNSANAEVQSDLQVEGIDSEGTASPETTQTSIDAEPSSSPEEIGAETLTESQETEVESKSEELTSPDNVMALKNTLSVKEEANLAEFLTDVEIDAPQDASGNYIITPNGHYDIKLKFAETPTLQLDNNAVLSYTIPLSFSVGTFSNTTFDIGIVDSHGNAVLENNVFRVVDNVLYVELNKNDTEMYDRLVAMANVSFAIGLRGKFTQTVTEVQFNSKIKKTLTYEQVSDLTISKEAVHPNAAADNVEYTLKVVSRGNNNNVEITDSVVGTALTLNRDVLVVSNKRGTLPITPTYDGDRFTLSNINLTHEEELTITYSAAINFDELTNLGTAEETKNIATVKSDENPTPKTVERTVSINFRTLKKRAGNQTLVPGETHKYYVPWTVELNGDHKLTIGGLTIVDNLSMPQRSWFTGNGIKVTVTKTDGSVEVRDLNWADLTVRRESPNNEISGWDYTPPVSDGKAAYVIETMTIVDTTGALGDVMLNNSISVGRHITTPNVYIYVGVGDELKPKKEVVSYDSQTINWRITIPVPAAGYNAVVRVIDDIPYTLHNGVFYHDSFIDMNILGLLPGESYTVVQRTTGRYQGPEIRFYQNPEKTINGLQANPNGQIREITIELRSRVNQEWLELAHQNGYQARGGISPLHVNNASLRLDETRLGMSANALPKKQSIKKTYTGRSTVDLAGVTYPVFSYAVELTNPFEGDIVKDAFDTNFLRLYREGNLVIRGRNSRTDAYNSNGSVTVQELPTGVNFVLDNLPKDGNNLYQFYVIEYNLIVKDKAALDALNGLAFQSNGVVLTNIATWKEFKSQEVSTVYHYNPILDKRMTQAPSAMTGYIATFELVLNEGNMDVFPAEQTYTVKDQLSSGLRLLPDSIRVTKGDYVLDFGFDSQTNTITFNNVPDNKEVRITYNARVIGTGDVSFSNTVSVGQYIKTVTSTVTISSNGSGTASNPSITIVKRDKDDFAQGLAGAKFKLSYLNGADVIDVLDKNGQVVTFTTDAQGKFLIEGHQSNLGWVLWADGRTYLLTEIEAPSGYTPLATPVEFKLAEVVVDNTQYAIYGETLYVTNERPKVNVEATKSWHNVKPGAATPTVWFKLFRKVDGGELEEVPNAPIKVLETGNTMVVWDNLHAQDLQARAYIYVVKEVDANGNDFVPTGFIKEENGLHVSNTYDERTEIKVTKVWDDANNQDGKRPDKVVVTLFADGQKVETVEITATADWMHVFTNLPKYKDGREVVYTVTEEAVAGYDAPIIDNFNILNRRTPEMVEIAVTKVWNDANNQDGKRPETITVKLYADTVDTGTELVLSEANNWQGTFSGLAKYKDGQEITYTISEVSVEGYETTIVGNAIDGFVVTNTYVPPMDPPTPPPSTPPKPQLPQTGEGDMTVLIGIAAILILSGVLMIIRTNKKKD